jgi:hypothetical protein
MSKHIYLPDVVFNCASVSFRVLIRDLIPISGRACSGFRPGLRPDPAPPLAPHPHVCPLPLYLILFPAQQPEVSSHLPLSSPLLSLLLPSPCAPAGPWRRLGRALAARPASPSVAPHCAPRSCLGRAPQLRPGRAP